MEEQVILVDYNDVPTGTMPKLAAHQDGGHLHRAFSVLLFDHQGRMMLQQRASTKYHCPGLRANTCCSHPRPGEHTVDAAYRRMREEMGLSAEIEKLFHFVYKAHFDNGLTEHEFDHVFVGITNHSPSLNPEEVQNRKWITRQDLQDDIQDNSQRYAARFLNMIREHGTHFTKRLDKKSIDYQPKK